jgi:hypothetical protein
MKHLFFSKSVRSLALLATILIAFSLIARAQTAGFDLFQTGTGASVDLSSLGLGTIQLQGVPIQSSTGNTDTIMQRTQNVPQGGGPVTVQVYALFMKSAASFTFGGQSVDLYVTINNSGGAIPTTVLPQPDALSGSSGTVTVRTDGTFDSNVTVNADLIFVKAGTSPTVASNIVASKAAPANTMTSTNSSWTATPPANYPTDPCYPAGGFFPVPVHRGPHPVVPGKKNPVRVPALSPAQISGPLNPAPAVAVPVCQIAQ